MEYGSASTKHLESNTNSSNNKRVTFKSSLVYPSHVSDKYSDHSSDTIYSYSSESSPEDYVQVNPKTLPKFKAPNNIPKPYGAPKSSHKTEKVDVPSEAFRRIQESINESQQSTHESLVTHPSQILSPPVQVMGRPGPAYDPNRIPASIFSKPSTPSDWSLASNESLFSIQIGNSFSRDHLARMGYKSGELLKSGELSTYDSRELYKSGELCSAADLATPCGAMGFRQRSPTAKGVKLNEDFHMDMKIEEEMNPRETVVVDEQIDYVAKVPVNNRVDANSNRHSDICEANIQSVVVYKKKKSSWYCCKALFCCKWTWCCFKWPSCSCKWLRWPICSTNCCKWPSCHCLSCSYACCSCWKRKPQVPCYDALCILRERGLMGTEKIYREPQHDTRLSSLKTSTRDQCSCFSCTSSCSCCSC